MSSSASAPPRSTSTASTSRRTPLSSEGSSPSWSRNPPRTRPWRSCFGLRERYEAHHRCEITDDAIDRGALPDLSRYIADRFLPDKAIDLIDEAGSAARIKQYMFQKEQTGEVDKATSMEAMEMWRALKQVSEAKEAAVRGLLFEEATLLRDREREVKNNLTKLGVKIDELTGDGAYGGAKVTIDEIESVAAMWSGIPVQRMTLDEAEILANMDEDLSGSVIGQEEAVVACPDRSGAPGAA